ncbi:hypothetical protein DV736_g2490, partial [Chaetothyriales sp. CBS 134916]
METLPFWKAGGHLLHSRRDALNVLEGFLQGVPRSSLSRYQGTDIVVSGNIFVLKGEHTIDLWDDGKEWILDEKDGFKIGKASDGSEIVRKTISILAGKTTYHIISYYAPSIARTLVRPPHKELRRELMTFLEKVKIPEGILNLMPPDLQSNLEPTIMAPVPIREQDPADVKSEIIPIPKERAAMAVGTDWPRLGAEPHNLKEHVTFLHGAYTQLQAVKDPYTAIPATTIDPLIDSTLRLLSKVTRYLEEQPDTRLTTQIQGLFKEQRDAQLKDHEAIKAVINAATAPLKAAPPPSGTRVASWAQVAATAGPPPGHVTPPDTVLSSSNTSTLTAYKGREVTVKLLDHAVAQRLRQLSPSQLKNKVNNILRETPKVKDIKVAAAHQLKSGDITVITDSLDNATELQTHTDWARGLGPKAEVIRKTYGAIVHGIPVSTINMKDQQGTIQRILSDNFSVIPHAKITYVGWLTKESVKKRNSSIVIEFTQPEMANAIIYAGFLWEGLIHNCQLRTASATDPNDKTGPVPPTSSSDDANGPVRQNQQPARSSNQPIREPRLLRSSRRQQQRNPTPPPTETHVTHPEPTTRPEATVQSQQTTDHIPAVPTVVSRGPSAAQGAAASPQNPPAPLPVYSIEDDDWLRDLDLNWDDTIAVGPTPGLSTIPDNQHHAAGLSPRELARLERAAVTFDNLPPPRRGCYCEEHAHLYENWPIQDAELIIGTCMRECPYCSFRQESSAELRKHIKGRHGKRNLTVRKEKFGEKGIVPGWNALPMTQTQHTQDTTYNTRKSREIMAEAFRRSEIFDYDILAIQEPYQNRFQHTTHHPAKEQFHLLYFDSESTRSCIFVNTRIDPATWSVRYVNEDICILDLETNQGHLSLYNVYNDPEKDDRTRILQDLAQELNTEQPENHVLLLGDFNLHHPQWSGTQTRRTCSEARMLLNITESSCLWQLTPVGLKTHRWFTNDTTIDLTFATHTMREQLLQCKVTHELDCDSDHLPVSTWFNWDWKQATVRRRRRWAAMDVDKLRSIVQTEMRLAEPLGWDSPEALDNQTALLTDILTKAIDGSTPWSNPSPRALPGFDKECKDACGETQRLRRRWQFTRSEEDWQAYKTARNAKGRLIKKSLQQNHRSKITEAASKPKGIWKIAKWAVKRQSLPPASVTPALSREDGSLETDAEGKTNLLRASFFPPPARADLSDTEGYQYPEPCPLPPITESEIERAIRGAAPNKAPGTDGITNNVLQKVLDLILPTLHQLFSASWNLGYFPQHFRQSITVVLRKQGKDDYSQPKAYRPIALLNTIGKGLEAVIGTRLMYLAEKFNLLPVNHIGGRKMASTEHAIHSLLTRIYQAWDRKQVASLLLLDVSGAFDNVSHPRLLHNLRKRRIDPTTVNWIASFLRDRTTTLVLPEFTERATGLQIDNRLTWKDHVQRIQQKASQRLTALSSLASSTWGADLTTLRQVYQAMLLPQFLYGCSVWYKAQEHRQPGRPRKGQSQIARLLTPVQRRAAQIITGAFRTTAASAVEVEAHLLPLDQQMEKLSLHTTLRLLSCPSRPIPIKVGGRQRYSRENPITHHARVLRKRYQINHTNLEHRQPYIVTPWWKPPSVVVANTPEDAISQHNSVCMRTDITCIYTDGSGINGHVGAAAVILSTPNSISSPVLQRRTQYMGTDTQSTVYAAELKGILLALEILIANPNPEHNSFTIFTDNQSALKTLRNPGNTSGQSILVELLQTLDKATVSGLDVHFRWIPAHRGVPGNEIVDLIAKEAANPPPTDETINQDPHQNPDNNIIKTLLTTAKRTINTALHQDWESIWAHAKHGRVLHALGRKPDKKTLELHRRLPRPTSSVITQMRTSKIGLNVYLHSINRADTSQCTCNQGQQTVEHVLLRCRNWTKERQEMWAGSRPVLSLKGVLSNQKLVVRAAHMMLRTGLLQQFQAVPPTAPTA